MRRLCRGVGKLVAAICHGGWIAISAGVYRGVRVTGSPGIKDDLVNAGADLGRRARSSSIAISSPAASPTICPTFAAAMWQVLTRSEPATHHARELDGNGARLWERCLGVLAVPLLVLLNAFFVAAEFSLVAVRRTRVDELLTAAAIGRGRGQICDRQSRRRDRRHATRHYAGQPGPGLGRRAGDRAASGPAVRLLAGRWRLVRRRTRPAIVLAFALITLLHVVLGELAPKAVALQRPDMRQPVGRAAAVAGSQASCGRSSP